MWIRRRESSQNHVRMPSKVGAEVWRIGIAWIRTTASVSIDTLLLGQHSRNLQSGHSRIELFCVSQGIGCAHVDTRVVHRIHIFLVCRYCHSNKVA